MMTEIIAHKAARRRKADEELRAAVREARANGETLRALAEAAGVTHQTIVNWTRQPK
jgi:DNA invertase Pin-like site-specific DNA recombinase